MKNSGEIELTKEQISDLTFIRGNIELVATETNPLSDIYSYINGFILKRGDIEIFFNFSMTTSIVGTIIIKYKDEEVIKFDIISIDDHWNGVISHLELYNKKDSRHDFKIAWDFVCDNLKDELQSVRDNIKRENTKKDKLIDEFYASIK